MFQLTARERKVIIGLALVILSGAAVKYFKATSPRPVYADSRNAPGALKNKTGIGAVPQGNVAGNTAKSPNDAAAGVESPFPVNVNIATQLELETIPGIGPALARRIIEYRSAHTNFSSLDDLTKIKGIGKKKLEKIKSYISL